MSFEKIDSLVKARMQERGFGRQVDAISVVQTTEAFFKSKFPSFCHKITPVSFKHGVLTVASLSAPIASELKLHEKLMINHINSVLKTDIVKRIKFLL